MVKGGCPNTSGQVSFVNMIKKISIIISIIFVLLGISYIIKYQYIDKTQLHNKIETKVTQTVQKIEEVKTTIVPKPTTIQENGLPNYHLIKTAFIPQAPDKNWDQPWQDACEEAALLTAFYYFNNSTPTIDEIKDKILDIIDYETKQQWGNSINISKVRQINQDYLGLKSDIIIDPTIDDIKKSLVGNHPVLVPGAGKILFKENKYFNDGGPEYHALTILGYDDDKQKFIVHDVGTRHGAYFKYSYNLLMESIHDFPDTNKKEDILQGSKKILILKPNET